MLLKSLKFHKNFHQKMHSHNIDDKKNKIFFVEIISETTDKIIRAI